jgi:hypothetical protein
MAAPAAALEYVDPPHWAVVIDACRSDNTGHCARFRKPFEADNEIACMMSGWQAASQWLMQNPGWVLKKQACAPAHEKDI